MMKAGGVKERIPNLLFAIEMDYSLEEQIIRVAVVIGIIAVKLHSKTILELEAGAFQIISRAYLSQVIPHVWIVASGTQKNSIIHGFRPS